MSLGKFFSLFLDTIFPSQVPDLEKINHHRKVKIISENPKIFAFLPYREKLVQDLIWKIKYKKNKKAINLVAGIVFEEILDECSENFLEKNIIITPAPMSVKRKRERGYNQAELLVKALEKKDEQNLFSYNYQVLLKTKNTKPQSEIKKRKDRIENLKNCFEVKDPKKIFGKTVIVIDDVTTTGTTFKEIHNVLKDSNVKDVICLAIAH